MKVNFDDIPKFLINLDRREDRLKSVSEEFQYMGWTFERFSAVDTNSYEGCAYSHQRIAKLILERGYEYAMVFEDDIFFMPYSKSAIAEIESELNEIEWDFYHLILSNNQDILFYNHNPEIIYSMIYQFNGLRSYEFKHQLYQIAFRPKIDPIYTQDFYNRRKKIDSYNKKPNGKYIFGHRNKVIEMMQTWNT